MRIKEYKEIDEKVYSFEHKSGLKIYLHSKKDFQKNYALFATNFGSVDSAYREGEKVTQIPDGTAHFLEHKMFEEPEGDVFEKFSALGASANAFTSFDVTAYLFSATSNFYENLEVLLSFVQNPYFTDENVAKEQGIIGQEIRMYDDDPSWRVFFNMIEGMYKNHPVRKDIAGSIESISEITKELLFDCHRNFYNPSNMILFISGNADPKKVEEVVEKCIKTTEKPAHERILTEEDDKIYTSFKEQKLSVSKPIFSIGFKEKQAKDPVKADVLYTLLLSVLLGRSSELYNKLYDENLVNSEFSASYSCGRGFAFVEISGESENPEKVRDIILETLEKVRKEGILKTDFERARKALYGKYLRMLNVSEAIANEFVKTAFRGGDFLEWPTVLLKTEFEEIVNLFEKCMQKDKCVLSVVKPVD